MIYPVYYVPKTKQWRAVAANTFIGLYNKREDAVRAYNEFAEESPELELETINTKEDVLLALSNENLALRSEVYRLRKVNKELRRQLKG
jgi:hypothetical protein